MKKSILALSIIGVLTGCSDSDSSKSNENNSPELRTTTVELVDKEAQKSNIDNNQIQHNVLYDGYILSYMDSNGNKKIISDNAKIGERYDISYTGDITVSVEHPQDIDGVSEKYSLAAKLSPTKINLLF